MKNILPICAVALASVSSCWASDLSPQQALSRLKNSGQLKSKYSKFSSPKEKDEKVKLESTIGD